MSNGDNMEGRMKGFFRTDFTETQVTCRRESTQGRRETRNLEGYSRVRNVRNLESSEGLRRVDHYKPTDSNILSHPVGVD